MRAAASRSAASWVALPSTARSSSATSTLTLGTSTLTARGVPLRSSIVPRLGSRCSRRCRCFSAISRHSGPSSIWTRHALDTMPPSARPITPHQYAHARADPSSAHRVEVLHGSPSVLSALAAARSSSSSADRGAIGNNPLGWRGLHAEERSRDNLDPLGCLVARRLDLEDALHLSKPCLVLAGMSQLVAQLNRAPAQCQVDDERARRRDDGKRPHRQERARDAAHGTSTKVATRRAARSLALRERALCCCSSSPARTGFLVRGSQPSPTKARFTMRSSSE